MKVVFSEFTSSFNFHEKLFLFGKWRTMFLLEKRLQFYGSFICGSGGFAQSSSLLKDSLPLKNIKTETKEKNWLKTQARGRVVLVRDRNDDLALVRIDLQKKISHHNLTRVPCPYANGNGQFLYICNSFVEETVIENVTVLL